MATLADFGCGTGTQQVEKPKEIQKVKGKKHEPAAFHIADQDYLQALTEWENECKVNNETFLHWTFDYYSRIELGNKIEFISGNHTFERHNKGRSKSFGGSWGLGYSCHSQEEAKLLWDSLIAAKTQRLSMPFHAEKADDFSLRGLKNENIKVFFSSRAKEYLQRMGWDFDEFNKAWDGVKETETTHEAIAKSDRNHELQALIDDYNHKIWNRRDELKEIINHPLEAAEMKLTDPATILSNKFTEYIEWSKKYKALQAEHDALAKEFRGCA